MVRRRHRCPKNALSAPGITPPHTSSSAHQQTWEAWSGICRCMYTYMAYIRRQYAYGLACGVARHCTDNGIHLHVSRRELHRWYRQPHCRSPTVRPESIRRWCEHSGVVMRYARWTFVRASSGNAAKLLRQLAYPLPDVIIR